MTLANLFKAQAIFVWLYAALFWVAPHIAAQGPGWTLTPAYIWCHLAKYLAIPLIALGLFLMDGAFLGR